ncbi:MAG: hypothetical protein LBF83_05610 [Spirochaetaceae bacterium]|jgi:hypothetical protein|nr:hypothetical protein [Spirochaetaceae bacterium]
MVLGQVNAAFGFDFKYTSQSTDVMGFFQDEIAEYMNMLYDGRDVPFYVSCYDNLLSAPDDDDPDFSHLSSVLTATTGSFIRINKHFLIPVNISSAYLLNNDVQDLNFLFDSGLVFQNRMGIIGFFAGYNYSYYQKTIRTKSYTDDNWKWHPGEEYTEEYSDTNIKYALVPVINTRDFPIVGFAVNKLEGYINADQNNETNYSIKLVSRAIKMGPFAINSIEPYYSKKRFDLHAQSKVYGVLTNAEITDRFVFFLDAGYRDYFDITLTSHLYDDTPYIRFGFPLDYDWQYKDHWNGISFYIDKEFPFPKIGYITQFGSSRLSMELGFYKSFNFALSYRIIIGGTNGRAGKKSSGQHKTAHNRPVYDSPPSPAGAGDRVAG